MRALVILILLFAGTSTGVAQEVPPGDPPVQNSVVIERKLSPTESGPTKNTKNSWYLRPSNRERRRLFLKSFFGSVGLGRSIVTSGYNTWRNSPEEWGGKWDGFGKRLASNMGSRAIGNSVKYVLEETMSLDSRFYRSRNRSVGAKIKNALLSPVTARRKDGRRVIGVPKLVGSYSSNVIAREAWYPRRYSYKDGLKASTVSLGFEAAFNLFKEFVWKR